MEGCELGLREYWDDVYTSEIGNFSDHGDEGETWFGDDVLETVVEWTDEVIREHCTISSSPQSASILDLGTGNGHFLHALRLKGYENLTGSDYSRQSVELCEKISNAKGVKDIRFVVDDVLDTKIEERFDVVCDKGTFDAIGLAPDGPQKRVVYIRTAWELLKETGILVITSCNSTKDELVREFGSSSGPGCFAYVDHVKTYPTFRFGGVEGSRVSTVAFRKVHVS